MLKRNIVNNTGLIANLPYVYNFQSSIPSGTITLFQQTTAPVGWTKLTVHNNKTLRIVTGTTSFGGSNPFSTQFVNTAPVFTNNSLTATATTLSLTQVAAHTHLVGGGTGVYCPTFTSVTYYAPGATAVSSASTGGGGSHAHTTSGTTASTNITLNVQYVDLILAQKN